MTLYYTQSILEAWAINHSCVGWYFAVQLVAKWFDSFKTPPSRSLKQTKRDHLIHHISIFIFRAVEIPTCGIMGVWGAETEYKQEIKYIYIYIRFQVRRNARGIFMYSLLHYAYTMFDHAVM
jgi:hypothetical protein